MSDVIDKPKLCDCYCHDHDGKIIHMFPCCWQCTKCRVRVKIAHVEDHIIRHLEEEEPR